MFGRRPRPRLWVILLTEWHRQTDRQTDIQNDRSHYSASLGGVITVNAVALHCVKAHRQSQWRSPNFYPCKMYTRYILKIKLCPRNYLVDIYPCAKFYCNSFKGSLPANKWNITLLWLFLLSCPVQVILHSRVREQVAPLDGFWTVYGLA